MTNYHFISDDDFWSYLPLSSGNQKYQHCHFFNALFLQRSTFSKETELTWARHFLSSSCNNKLNTKSMAFLDCKELIRIDPQIEDALANLWKLIALYQTPELFDSQITRLLCQLLNIQGVPVNQHPLMALHDTKVYQLQVAIVQDLELI